MRALLRVCASTIVAVSACGPTAQNVVQTESTSESAADTATEGGDRGSASEASGASSGGGAGTTLTDSSSSGDPHPDSGAAETSTTETTTSGAIVPPGNVYTLLYCQESQERPNLLIEAYVLDEQVRSCVPPARVPGVGDSLVLVIDSWDGESGEFIFSNEGPHHANIGGPDGVVGSIELSVAGAYDPVSAYVVVEDWMEGALDLTTCPPAPIELPCAP